MTSETGHRLVESLDLSVDPRAMKKEIRRLVTPKSVSEYRAKISSKANLPEGLSWIPRRVQAGSSWLTASIWTGPVQRLNCPPSVLTSALPILGTTNNSSVITICGDGTDAQGVMSIVESKTGQTSICMLHVDPARPMDTQKHAVSEMQPLCRCY